jgi:hypothetical protein
VRTEAWGARDTIGAVREIPRLVRRWIEIGERPRHAIRLGLTRAFWLTLRALWSCENCDTSGGIRDSMGIDVCGCWWGSRLNRQYPQGWSYYPGDICRHGIYTGGCGRDLMCWSCEMGDL